MVFVIYALLLMTICNVYGQNFVTDSRTEITAHLAQ